MRARPSVGAIGHSSLPIALSTSGAVAAPQPVKHAVLISVDGLPQSDLDWYVANHPRLRAPQAHDAGRAHVPQLLALDPHAPRPVQIGGTEFLPGLG